MKRKIQKRNRSGKLEQFVVTYDEHGVVDTIERNGELLVSTHRDAQKILRNADELRSGFVPAGFEWTR
jgi:hypothetical protein